MAIPESRTYESQGLRLHYADWGNETAPPLILVHGGRDHCRSWDVLARALRPHFHVLAPDLRGHGDSDWTKGGSYALTEYVYDLTRLVQTLAVPRVTLVGHSMGGMVSLIYSGSFPDKVSALVVLDGVTVLPGGKSPPPAHERIAKWVDQLDRLHDRTPHRYPAIEDAAARMQAHNKRLSRELALHLATHGTRQNADGTLSWKFDPYQRASAPHRLWSDDHVALWSRIACPTLLVNASESFLGGARAAGLADHFKQARIETIFDAGHWLHHDKPEEVLGAIRVFLGVS
ncbi:alpha/beta hydrolase [Bradyrhizobium manausense]|uniref:alpha/beta fold hydrolase n=1 Tax=Bradyrhizobium TaxID=374 RepID=UPI001BAA91E1|nr:MULTISPECIES: alpha/beta hydrolase [Bradyrhizobium]MBR0829932.1 alpha/beta hydrolase [Bradyrhizobium manausense]UVO27674.1 alpha/beta hydrolase [Bradyrhizobium arachidis]